MLSVAIDKLTYILTLVRALFDDVAVVLEQVVDEELVEVSCRGVMVLIDLSCQGLAEDQSVHKTARNWLQLSQEHKQVSIEHS